MASVGRWALRGSPRSSRSEIRLVGGVTGVGSCRVFSCDACVTKVVDNNLLMPMSAMALETTLVMTSTGQVPLKGSVEVRSSETLTFLVTKTLRRVITSRFGMPQLQPAAIT